MEIEHISGNTYYMPGATSIGIYITDNYATIIDTGIDENNIRKVFNYLNERGIKINNVLNTHSHADHVGGNYFVEKKGISEFYASKTESIFIKNPYLISSQMFGSLPPRFMMTKLIVPEKTNAEIKQNFPDIFRVIELPGHSWEMIGFITPDNVFFCADSLYSESIIEKHPLLFHLNTDEFLKTMEKVEKIHVDYYVLSHGGLMKNITVVKEKNIESMENIIDYILNLVPNYAENIYSSLLNEIKIKDLWEYFLNRVPFNSIITYLSHKDKIKISLMENKIFINKL